MQRREFLQNGLLLGVTGTVPGTTLAASQLSDNAPPLTDSDIYDLLRWATERKKVDVLNFLTSLGINVNAKSEYGSETPLFAAMSDKNLDMVKCLVSHGANVNAKSDKGETPLHKAAYRYEYNVLQSDFELIQFRQCQFWKRIETVGTVQRRRREDFRFHFPRLEKNCSGSVGFRCRKTRISSPNFRCRFREGVDQSGGGQ